MRALLTLVPFVGLCTLVVSGAAAAQVPLLGQKPNAAASQNPKAAQQQQQQQQAEKKRLAAFKKLVFDRRPSSILKAWATPEPKPESTPAAAAKAGAAEQPEPATSPAAEPRPDELQPASGVLTPEQIQALIDAEANAPPPAAQPAEGAPANPTTATAQPSAEALAAKRLAREMETLQRDVTLGRWHKVGEFFQTLPEKERKGAYEHFLTVLPRHPNKPPSRLPPNLQEKNRYSFADVLAIAGLAPGGFDKQQSKKLAPIVRRALDDGSVPEELVRLLEIEVQKPAEQRRLDRREAALLLAALKMEGELGVFLPTASEAEANDDREALNLLARHALARFAKDQHRKWLEVAWQVTQAALKKGDVDKAQKEEALRRAVELAPKVREDLGPAWLAESFTKRPQRGMEIIATIGGQVAQGFSAKGQDPDFRATGLRLQKTAVEALLATAPELAEQWRPTLGLLASGWIQEAAHSNRYSKTSSYGSFMERDAYGNVYWVNRRMGGGGQVRTVEPADLLEAQPGERWASLLDDALRPHFVTVSAQLWLKVNEYERAFPYIEELAATNPRKAKELANEFLRVWEDNNNPNTNRRTGSYMYVYGFNSRANAIPLTRSKQERNLKELAEYVARLRALPIGGVDPDRLMSAFVAAHSAAEVYRLDTIRQVFGEIDELDPVVLGRLLTTMRTNLATIWRVPAVQEKAKTRRSQKEMLEQVAEGYATALRIAQDALTARGRHWALLTAAASLLHDQNNFAKELRKSSDFSERRKQAFEIYAEAADHYSSIADGLARDEESDIPFTSWFYAALGAADLGAIDESTVVAKSQLPLIREALENLPPGSRKRHKDRFANLLFTRMSAVKPQIKYRYLEGGFAIVDEDNEQTREARKVWQYYQDLLGELRLEAVVDGSSAVGTEPFGVRIDIVHSEQVAKSSGGFQKYATNQNDANYAFNYGRPTENYRDKFHDAVIAALQENFEVLSVTFNSEKMEALRHEDPRWQRTPYAYLLLRARGPQVDRIPEIRLDLDFLDTTGYAILPIGSSPVAIDASATPEERPFEGLEVTQLLDERRVDEGKVSLEIKAKSRGLVPDLDTFLDLELPGFAVDKEVDQGAAVVRFSDDQTLVETERVWLLHLRPESETARPSSFRFGAPKIVGVTAVYQRYDDADLETVSENVALRRGPIGTNPWWAWLLLGLGAVLYLIWFLFAKPAPAGPSQREDVLRMPAHVTPFSVLALLQRIRSVGQLSGPQRDQLDADIRRIEASHFSREHGGGIDLDEIARRWLQKAG